MATVHTAGKRDDDAQRKRQERGSGVQEIGSPGVNPNKGGAGGVDS